MKCLERTDLTGFFIVHYYCACPEGTGFVLRGSYFLFDFFYLSGSKHINLLLLWAFSPQRLSVWCRLPNGKWDLGKIQETLGDEATISLLSGTVSFSFSFSFFVPDAI